MTPSMRSRTVQLPPCWELANKVFETYRTKKITSGNIALWGPPAVGKTYAAQQLAKGLGLPWFEVTLNEDQSVQELTSHFIQEKGDFVPHYGIIARAFRSKKGAVLIMNEIQRASGAVQDMLLNITDNPEVRSISFLATQEEIRDNDKVIIVATSNSPMESLDPALEGRFPRIHINEMHPDLQLLIDRGIPGLGHLVSNSLKDPKRALDPRRAMDAGKWVAMGLSVSEALDYEFGRTRAEEILPALMASL